MLHLERQAWRAGARRIAGVDEAGRGPLAGPVTAAAVLFDRGFLTAEETGLLDGLTDSKRLSPSRREAFSALLSASDGCAVCIGWASVDEIDQLNILAATHLAMCRALAGLPEPPDCALVDGRPVPGLPVPSTAVTGGDGASLSIAAASVMAKVARDRYMCRLDGNHPAYGFSAHKGYGTPRHLAALKRHGPCTAHRRSFAPVRQLQLDLSDAGA